jgi:hypothetical protein
MKSGNGGEAATWFFKCRAHALGGLGCLFMVLFSVVASVELTVLANLLLR